MNVPNKPGLSCFHNCQKEKKYLQRWWLEWSHLHAYIALLKTRKSLSIFNQF